MTLRRTDAQKFIKNIKAHLKAEYKLESKGECLLGNERWCSRADISVHWKKTRLFIEVEGSQPHPDTNVTKYWYWLEKEKPKGMVVLIHVFGHEFYANNYRSRTTLCGFMSKKIRAANKRFRYLAIPEGMHHANSHSWKISKLLNETKNEIRTILK